MRITQSFRGIDLSLHVVHHLDRLQPEVLFVPDGPPRPLFRTVTQVGGTYQHVLGPLIMKVEAGYRWFAAPENNLTAFGPVQDRDHLQVAVGLEYGFIIEDSVELTALAEGTSIFFVTEAVRRQLGIFQRDLLLGLRATLGDTNSTEMLFSTIVDLEDPDQLLFNVSYTQRFWETWAISAAIRMVFSPLNQTLNQGFAVPPASDHVRLFVTRYF